MACNYADVIRKDLKIYGRKSVDKPCQVYGNFHAGNHGMIAGRWAYIVV